MTHDASARSLDPVPPGPGAPVGIGPAEFAGFSYLFGAPNEAQRSAWGENLAADAELFRKLISFGLPDRFMWDDLLPSSDFRWDNPTIPSGYTYLLQFVAHDTVQSSIPFWAAAGLGVDAENCRRAGLMLHALYGGGPTACPAAFQPEPAMDENRYLLRIGRIAHGSEAAGRCPMRDLARVNVPAAFDGPNGASVNFDKAETVAIADARNDDNVILSQLTVLFALAHNVIAAAVNSRKAEAKFAFARAVMLRMYHAIIRTDLLPKLLHPDIWPVIRARPADSGEWLWQSPGLPVEFSHGAFRVGHAMVRDGYRLNGEFQAIKDVVTHSLIVRPSNARKPLERSWILGWSQFFQLPTGTPNYSSRISPSRSRLDQDVLFPTRNESGSDGTSFRDFLSAAAARMWTVDALIEELAARSPGLIPQNWFFWMRSDRRRVIKDWLTNSTACLTRAGLSPAEIDRLAADPPLPFFVLLEAGLDRDPRLQGRCMGVLGSIIVGEVLGKRLAVEKHRIERLAAAAGPALPADMWARIEAIDSMPALVEFVADFGNLRGCASIPFI